MGKELYCDNCRNAVAIETALQNIVIGETQIGEVCLTCASQLSHALKGQFADAAKQVQDAKIAVQQQAAQAAVAEPAVEPQPELPAQEAADVKETQDGQ